MTKKEFHDLLGDLEAQLREADEEMFLQALEDYEDWEMTVSDYVDGVYRNIRKARIALRKEMEG